MRLCSVEGCKKKHYAKGLCHQHWQRQSRGALLVYRKLGFGFHCDNHTKRRYDCKECRSIYMRAYRQLPEQAAKRTSYNKTHYRENRTLYRSIGAFRRAALRNATPTWVDRYKLDSVYKSCPKGFHVDHIVPLTHPEVCGLHVPWNLQILTKAENLSKGNKLVTI